MTTLYIRDVADDVAQTLKERAASEGRSLSAFVAAELAKIAARPTNAQIVVILRELDRSSGPSREDIIETLQAERR